MIKKKVQYLILTLGFIASFGLASVPLFAGATTIIGDACLEEPDSAICAHKDDSLLSSVGTITKTLLFVLGAIAVLVIIIAGIMYVVSGGEAAAVKKAKDMILYAVVGLVVALLAFAIVSFVLTNMTTTPVTPAVPVEAPTTPGVFYPPSGVPDPSINN